MKKIVALVLALMLALSCTAALAEETPATAMNFTLTPALDNNGAISLLQMMGEASTAEEQQVFSALMDMINALDLSLTISDAGFGTVDVMLNDTVLANAAISGAEDGSFIVTSSLIPSYALALTPEAMENLITAFEAEAGVSVDDVLSGASAAVSDEEMALYSAAIEALMTDISAQVQVLMEKGVLSEDQTCLSVTLTNNDLADLYEIILTHLKTDAALQQFIGVVLASANAELPAEEQISSDALIGMLEAICADLKSSEAMEVAWLDLYANADGSTSAQLDVMGLMLFTFDQYADNGMDITEVMLVTDSEGAGADWQQVYDAIVTGTDTENMVINLALGTADNGGTAGVDIVSGGMAFSLYGNSYSEGESMLNDLYLYVNSEEPIAGLILAATPAAAPAAPVVEGKKVIDLMTASEEDMNAVMLELQNIGLSTMLVNAQTAMPEHVSLLLQLITAMQQPATIPAQ